MKKTKKSHGKYYVVIKYLLILAVSGMFGAALGAVMSSISDNSGAIWDKFMAFMSVIIPPAQWIVFLVLAAISIVLYFIALGYVKKLEKNREDDDASQKANGLISLGLTICSVTLILCYWLFGFSVTLPIGPGMLLLGTGAIALMLVYYSTYMAYGVKLVKRINPEKHGDPLDLKFQKNWIDSCDEAEKMVIYQAAYQSYQLVGMVLLGAWVVTVMCSLFFGLGGYAVTVISVIWLTHTIGYQYYAMKLEKKKIN